MADDGHAGRRREARCRNSRVVSRGATCLALIAPFRLCSGVLLVADCVQVSTTLPDEATAQQFGRRLVEERLAACAQIAGPISSTYWWEGRVREASEWYCHLKTTSVVSAKLSRRIRELHPYEVPEIIVLVIKDGDASYLKWIGDTVELSPKVPVP